MTIGLHPKITGATLAGALVGMLVAEAERRGYTISGTEATDLTVIVSFLVGYFVPNGDSAAAPVEPAAAVPSANTKQLFTGSGTVVPAPPAPAPVVVVSPPQPAASSIITGPGAAG